MIDRRIFGLLVALPTLAWVSAQAGSVWLPGVGGVSNPSVETIQERKFANVVRQQFDFSCGSAALATLLTFHYEDPTAEMDAFNVMYDRGDKEKIAKAGFSLLDMKTYLESEGYQADGYQASLDTLAEAGVPAIALINYRGYRHFVVIKGLQDQRIMIGDPALGSRTVSRTEFQSLWDNGVLFIIKDRPEIGRRNFNLAKEWEALAVAPLGTAISRESLASLTVNLPTLGEF